MEETCQSIELELSVGGGGEKRAHDQFRRGIQKASTDEDGR